MPKDNIGADDKYGEIMSNTKLDKVYLTSGKYKLCVMASSLAEAAVILLVKCLAKRTARIDEKTKTVFMYSDPDLGEAIAASKTGFVSNFNDPEYSDSELHKEIEQNHEEDMFYNTSTLIDELIENTRKFQKVNVVFIDPSDEDSSSFTEDYNDED